ncbi:MAG: hypothetical protein K2O62_03705, partial [Clostridia bacterium]|nr:hypothetical protein [Clostridia bacterium]
LYIELKTDYQREYVGQENIDKLFAVEKALKPVKAAFNIKVEVSSVAVDASSTHKTAYYVGEKFSFKGLKLLVIYDDYSQEVIDGTQFKLVDRFDRALKVTDEAVTLEGLGTTLSIEITVSEGKAANGGLPAYAIALIVVGGVLVLAAAAAVTLFILNKKGVITLKFLDKLCKKQADGVTEGEGASEEAKTDATEEAENGTESGETATQVEEQTETDTKTEENSKDNGEEGKTE